MATTPPPPPEPAKPLRKSWFSLSRTSSTHVDHPSSTRKTKSKDKTKGKPKNKNKGKNKPDAIDLPAPHPDDPSSNPFLNDEERLRPIQFTPNRLQTLYVTPSERNLYLAAMAQLDRSPPPLPLWIQDDPAPTLPTVEHFPPLSSPDRIGHRANAPSLDWPTISSHSQPRSPKLVTSPQLAGGGGGLLVRDEFKRLPGRKDAQHAFLALTGSGTLRFTGFPVDVLAAMEEVLKEAWPPGIASTSDPLETLRRQDGVQLVWKIKLSGSVWKRPGSEELQSIRLILALLTRLATQGWTVVDTIQAGASKLDVHNLLFSYSLTSAIQPPAFFAISIPLPDRISLMFPPAKSTPALISAIRNAITFTNTPPSASSDKQTRVSLNGGTTTTTSTEAGRRAEGMTWKPNKGMIKLEGWVHDGVYRFWIRGMRRCLGGGLKRAAVESLQAPILLNIISVLSSLHFSLVKSIPLHPLSAFRDLLIFSSLPETGLAVEDAFVPRSEGPTTRSEGPVMVERTDSMPSPTPMTIAMPMSVPIPAQGSPHHNTFGPGTQPTSRRGTLLSRESQLDPIDGDAQNRKLPWTTILAEGPAERASARASRDHSQRVEDDDRSRPAAYHDNLPGRVFSTH